MNLNFTLISNNCGWIYYTVCVFVFITYWTSFRKCRVKLAKCFFLRRDGAEAGAKVFSNVKALSHHSYYVFWRGGESAPSRSRPKLYCANRTNWTNCQISQPYYNYIFLRLINDRNIVLWIHYENKVKKSRNLNGSSFKSIFKPVRKLQAIWQRCDIVLLSP